MITNNTKNLTSFTQLLGVDEIILQNQNENTYTFLLIGVPSKFNSQDINLSEQQIIITETTETISLIYETKKVLYTKNSNEILLSTTENPDNIIAISDVTDDTFSTSEANEFLIALSLLREFSDREAIRSEDNARKKGRWFVINGGFSQSTSINNTQNEVNQFLIDNPNCTKVGELDTSCVWGNHLCMSTQYFNCK